MHTIGSAAKWFDIETVKYSQGWLTVTAVNWLAQVETRKRVLTKAIFFRGVPILVRVKAGRKASLLSRTPSGTWFYLEIGDFMEEKLEKELLVGEIRGYIEILNAKGIDSPLRSLEVLDTMSVLDLRILSRRLRDMARTPSN